MEAHPAPEVSHLFFIWMNTRKIKKVVEGLLVGVAAFLLASIAFWSFQEAVYNPLVEAITRLLGDGYATYLLLLVASSLILVFILKRKLPFTR